MRQSQPWRLASILSLSLVGGCSSLITGLIPHLQQTYPTQSAAGIEWLVTIANLAALMTRLANPWLTRRLHARLGPYLLALGYLGAALSVWALLAWQSPTGIIAAAIFFNWIYSYTGPYLVYRTNLGLAADQIDLAASSLTIATIVSAFLAPPVWNSLSHLGLGALTLNALSWMAGVLAVIALGTLLTIIYPQRSKS